MYVGGSITGLRDWGMKVSGGTRGNALLETSGVRSVGQPQPSKVLVDLVQNGLDHFWPVEKGGLVDPIPPRHHRRPFALDLGQIARDHRGDVQPPINQKMVRIRPDTPQHFVNIVRVHGPFKPVKPRRKFRFAHRFLEVGGWLGVGGLDGG